MDGDGDHPFSYEDPTGAYCEEHEVTMVWKSERQPVPDEPARNGWTS
ncbi:hypothetical protein [Streptomyces sp. NPDC057509]